LSFGMLLILTTPWIQILVALRWLRIPSVIIDILGMTYRYIFLLLHTVNSMFLARRSRTLGGFSGAENRHWLFSIITTTLAKSHHLSEGIYIAMLSRGYQGEAKVLNDLRLRRLDLIWSASSLIVVAILFWVNTL
jgi:cobalt/nickel transport system permease protein